MSPLDRIFLLVGYQVDGHWMRWTLHDSQRRESIILNENGRPRSCPNAACKRNHTATVTRDRSSDLLERSFWVQCPKQQEAGNTEQYSQHRVAFAALVLCFCYAGRPKWLAESTKLVQCIPSWCWRQTLAVRTKRRVHCRFGMTDVRVSVSIDHRANRTLVVDVVASIVRTVPTAVSDAHPAWTRVWSWHELSVTSSRC